MWEREDSTVQREGVTCLCIGLRNPAAAAVEAGEAPPAT
jgi:hypothetical protein